MEKDFSGWFVVWFIGIGVGCISLSGWSGTLAGGIGCFCCDKGISWAVSNRDRWERNVVCAPDNMNISRRKPVFCICSASRWAECSLVGGTDSDGWGSGLSA